MLFMKGLLSADELLHFEKWGYVRVPQALSETFVERVRTVIWRKVEERYGMAESDPSTWRPEWCGINKDQIDGSARTQVSERLSDAISQILDQSPWRPLRTYGGLLMTMPEPGEPAWEATGIGWHFDNDPRSYLDGPDELMLFTFYSSIEACGGGTLALAGSHRLVEAFVQSGAAEGCNGNDLLKTFVQWHPYLTELQRGPAGARRVPYPMDTVCDINGIEVFVTEFTGEPGDAILCHPALLHASSRNTSNRPRIMRRANVRRLRERSAGAV